MFKDEIFKISKFLQFSKLNLKTRKSQKSIQYIKLKVGKIWHF